MQYILSHGIIQYFTNDICLGLLPGNPVYLSFLYRLLNGSIYGIRLINILISGATIFFVYKIGERVFDVRVGSIAALLCAVYNGLIVLSPTILTEPIFFFWFVMGLYILLCALDETSQKRWRIYSLSAGVFLAFGGLTRPILSAFAVVMALLCLLRDAGNALLREKYTIYYSPQIILACTVATCIVISVPIKNYICFDQFRFFSKYNSGVSLWLGSRPDTEGDEPPLRGLSYGDHELVAQGKDLTQLAIENIKMHFLSYLYWDMKKIGRLTVGSNLAWFSPHKTFRQWHRANNAGMWESAKLIMDISISVTVAFYGILGGIILRRNRKAMLLFATAVYMILATIPFLVNQRYGYPIFLINSVMAPAVMFHLHEHRSEHRLMNLSCCFMVIALIVYILAGA
ncbi:MAG: phospholipid carrier-dependent glycosyltransferase [Candidatus Aureabacteria bacterium]|nr:phospholipid carrier-dependent glycosyltransferase [Candidatus Auribacterota bacterium]